MEIDENLKVYLFDENEDGALDAILDCKRNTSGQVTEVLLDYNLDGTADCRVYFEYDNQNRVIRKSIDKNLSGVINFVVRYEYDRDGTPTAYYDDNADGKTDYIETSDGNIKDVRDTSQKISDTASDILKATVNGLPLPNSIKDAVNKEK